MSVELILIIIFLTAMITVAIAYRKSTLDHVEMEEGEAVLFEEVGVRVDHVSPVQTYIFKNCTVRITDRRIIIAQKIPFRKDKWVLKFIISLGYEGKGTDLGNTLKKGYLQFSIPRSEIIVKPHGISGILAIPVPESGLTRGQRIEISANNTDEFMKLLQ